MFTKRAAVRLALLLRKTSSPDLIQVAIKEFGLTHNPDEAGYILPDGKMLNFSGRRHVLSDYRRVGNKFVPKPGKKDWGRGQRGEDHREVSRFTEADWTDGMTEFMRETGAIRLQPRVGFDAIQKPTDAQVRVIALIWNKFWDTEPLFIQKSNARGSVVDSAEFNQPIRRQDILALF